MDHWPHLHVLYPRAVIHHVEANVEGNDKSSAILFCHESLYDALLEASTYPLSNTGVSENSARLQLSVALDLYRGLIRSLFGHLRWAPRQRTRFSLADISLVSRHDRREKNLFHIRIHVICLRPSSSCREIAAL